MNGEAAIHICILTLFRTRTCAGEREDLLPSSVFQAISDMNSCPLGFVRRTKRARGQ